MDIVVEEFLDNFRIKDDRLSLYLKDIFRELNSKNPISFISFCDYLDVPIFIATNIFNLFLGEKFETKDELSFSDFERGFMNFFQGSYEDLLFFTFKILDGNEDGLIEFCDVLKIVNFVSLYQFQTSYQNFWNELQNFGQLNFEKYKHYIQEADSDVFFIIILFIFINLPIKKFSLNFYENINQNKQIAKNVEKINTKKK